MAERSRRKTDGFPMLFVRYFRFASKLSQRRLLKIHADVMMLLARKAS